MPGNRATASVLVVVACALVAVLGCWPGSSEPAPNTAGDTLTPGGAEPASTADGAAATDGGASAPPDDDGTPNDGASPAAGGDGESTPPGDDETPSDDATPATGDDGEPTPSGDGETPDDGATPATGDDGESTPPNDDETPSDDATPATGDAGFVADHDATAAFASIPATFIDSARANFRIFYGHTSHGSQILAGMDMLASGDGRFAYALGAGGFIEEDGGVDLGHEGDLGWVDITRERLSEPQHGINVVMWSWCGGVSDNTAAGINAYLGAMEQLEQDYAGVTFVYMTGHLDGSGEGGNLRARNNQIRDYCTAHGKILFDFADIESYDPDGTYYPDASDWCEWCETWCATHGCENHGCVDDEDCQHSVCFNCYRKGQAFWWMMARIAGWSG